MTPRSTTIMYLLYIHTIRLILLNFARRMDMAEANKTLILAEKNGVTENSLFLTKYFLILIFDTSGSQASRVV